MSIDLHIHTTMSDGTLTPSEIVEFAHKKGLKCIAITDHDTVAGCNEARTCGDEIGVEVIAGVELSVKYNNSHIHLLGYFVDYANEKLLDGLTVLHKGRDIRNYEILRKLSDLGVSITEADLKKVSGDGETGRPHIAKILLQRGVVRSMDDAFEKYLGRNGSAYIDRFVYDIDQGIKLIHDADGLAVVAHPATLLKDDMDEGSILKELRAFGLDGVEAYYPTHSRKFRKQLIALARQNGLIITGGSDYHGTIRRGTTLAGGKGVSVPYELLDQMRQLIENK
jgi:3',5'-nucleoside bisphosphate phosphatase